MKTTCPRRGIALSVPPGRATSRNVAQWIVAGPSTPATMLFTSCRQNGSFGPRYATTAFRNRVLDGLLRAGVVRGCQIVRRRAGRPRLNRW